MTKSRQRYIEQRRQLNIWNGVVENANTDFKKEFWSFVGRRTKGRKGGVEALK